MVAHVTSDFSRWRFFESKFAQRKLTDGHSRKFGTVFAMFGSFSKDLTDRIPDSFNYFRRFRTSNSTHCGVCSALVSRLEWSRQFKSFELSHFWFLYRSDWANLIYYLLNICLRQPRVQVTLVIFFLGDSRIVGFYWNSVTFCRLWNRVWKPSVKDFKKI